MLLSVGTKIENLSLLKEMAETADDVLQIKIDSLLNIVLNLCASIIKANVKGIIEFKLILNELGIAESSHA